MEDAINLLKLSLVGYRKFLTAFLPATGQNSATVSGFHAFFESVNGFAAATVWLKCTFHNCFPFGVDRTATGSPHPGHVKGRQR